MEFILIGGGCYGTLNARRLLKAHNRDRIDCERIVIVDRDPCCLARREFSQEPLIRFAQSDWLAFLNDYLRAVTFPERACIVPAHHAPHLLFEWMMESVRAALPNARVRRKPCDLHIGLPYEAMCDGGNRCISMATWRCPLSCIEPAICPKTRGPRDWDLSELIKEQARLRWTDVDSVQVLRCRHYAYGVGIIPVEEVLKARDRVVKGALCGGMKRIVIATSSACHAVMGLLECDGGEEDG